MEISVERRKRFLNLVLNGERGIRSINDAKLFVAAICDEADHVQCMANLCSKEYGLTAARQSLFMSLSNDSLNDEVASFLRYFASEGPRQFAGGQMLRDLLLAMLKPDVLWHAYKTAVLHQALSENGIHAFASLIAELLILLPPASEFASQLDLKSTAQALIDTQQLQRSESADTRRLSYQLVDAVRSSCFSAEAPGTAADKAGGRHDNDFADFRQIAIFPTRDELLSDERPFLLPADDVFQMPATERVGVYLDNQFRLLREDLLAELREDLKDALSTKQSKRGGLRLCNMQFTGINCGGSGSSGGNNNIKPATVAVRCFDTVFRRLPKDEAGRTKYISDNKGFLKHGSFGCILAGNEVVAFATIDRDDNLLVKDPPVLLLRLTDEGAICRALTMFKLMRPHQISFVAIDTPFFAYEPVLQRLQAMSTLPLASPILGLHGHNPTAPSPFALDWLADKINSLEGKDISSIIGVPQAICLDRAQTKSIVAGLTQALCQIQGPPGTGKSFAGALLTKLFYVHSHTVILVLCYTNHALDQFLEEILNMGVDESQIVRLGSKYTARTEPMTLHNQSRTNVKETRAQWSARTFYKSDAERTAQRAVKRGLDFSRWRQSNQDTLQGLEFDKDDERFFHALSIPENEDDMVVAGPDGKAIDPTYLFQRWIVGRDAGIFEDQIAPHHREIWQMNSAERQKYYARWTHNAIAERADALIDTVREYSADYRAWINARGNNIADIMKTKRIIGCTTTAAAKYANQIALVKPGLVLVEEAGEVLESHVLTALSRDTKQLILIGDHLQLRPKIKNYALTVEQGDGYDLNRSLFERLILGGHLYTVLTKQHRMRPEISELVRQMMYPAIEDSEKARSRPDVHGLQKNVIFINHNHAEDSDSRLKDRLDLNSTSSRQNKFEVEIALKIVKYLAQQGYGTDQQVVLTPYLGQLRLIMDNMKEDHDPVLGDLDSHDLVKAGLLSPAGASQKKRQLRISTIDNFQGEESDIIVASLTRSNKRGDIGFMSAKERLNVLLSRARCGLILIGNAETFKRSKKGSTVWTPLFQQLVEGGHFFDGLPVKCEQHPTATAVLRSPQEFDVHCPNGGCSLPCRVILSCGKHRCPEKCHQLVDHSKVRCLAITETQCSRKHRIQRPCWQIAQRCPKCERDAGLQRLRQQKQDDYLAKLIAIEDQIAMQHGMAQDLQDESSRESTLQNKADELAKAKKSAQSKKDAHVKNTARLHSDAQNQNGKIGTVSSSEFTKRLPATGGESKTAQEWQREKDEFCVDNEHIDTIMGLVGLESVKEQVLMVMRKVDTSVRQGASLSKERFNVLLLGNPGTGKTTVARLYAKFLASTGVVAGEKVHETTASKLVNGGVNGYKHSIDELLNEGGGAMFIDEAYQLTNGGSGSGHQILDAIMDDAENLTGRVVFVLAGYRKEMEDLMAHNPGLTSRFPHEFGFTDYEDNELHQMLLLQIHLQFHGRMKVQAGPDGLFARIVAQRVGSGRDRPGFGNARAVENALAKIHSRQVARLSAARLAKEPQDDFMLTKYDMLGPEPGEALRSSKAWLELQSLIGLEEVKRSIEGLMQSVQYNYARELEEAPLSLFNLNRVFLGSPGTGKTTVAKLYGRVLSDLGLLSNGEVIVKNPSDFVGDVLGASEKTTKGILSATAGKVLVIDEAYGLHSSTNGPSADIYKTAVIDTLVAEIQSVPGDDRCVLLLGYQDEMETMLRNANPGLARRFPISEAFHFNDFTDEELEQVVKLKLKQGAYVASADAMRCIMESLRRARNQLHFGNAGEVDILLNRAKQHHQRRCKRDELVYNNVLEAEDFDVTFGQHSTSIVELFRDSFEQDEFVARLEQIQGVVVSLKARDLDPRSRVPYNFVFCGPPGTGKTSTARKMGQIYYDLGILATKEVLEKSASDLVGLYVGHTGDKTKRLLESALGKVLLIDEAYRLASGDFAKEAMDELVDLLTKPQFLQKLVVILAGYDHDIQRLLVVNPGLTSRFPEKVVFKSLSSESCAKLLVQELAKEVYLDLTQIQAISASTSILMAFDLLISIGDWANARDVQTLAKLVSNDALERAADVSSAELIQVGEIDVLHALEGMAAERSRRAALLVPITPKLGAQRSHHAVPSATPAPTPAPPGTSADVPEVATADSLGFAEAQDGAGTEPQRDLGVSDDVWSTLAVDKQKAIDTEKHFEQIVSTCKEQEQHQQDQEDDSTSSAEENDNLTANSTTRLRRERERVRYEQLRREKEEMERQREHETRMQRKLRRMGVCCQGFSWIKQAAGYRCAGGSHYVSYAALDAAPLT